MTTSTRLDGNALRRFATVREGLPFRLTFTPPAASVTTVGGLLSWLDAYAAHAARELAKVEEKRRDNDRAAIVLRGLRNDLANAASTLAELDARERAFDEAEVAAGWADVEAGAQFDRDNPPRA